MHDLHSQIRIRHSRFRAACIRHERGIHANMHLSAHLQATHVRNLTPAQHKKESGEQDNLTLPPTMDHLIPYTRRDTAIEHQEDTQDYQSSMSTKRHQWLMSRVIEVVEQGELGEVLTRHSCPPDAPGPGQSPVSALLVRLDVSEVSVVALHPRIRVMGRPIDELGGLDHALETLHAGDLREQHLQPVRELELEVHVGERFNVDAVWANWLDEAA
mmetsp:Transcript_7770/g.19084  ORF Transcript_7770/g.19084 Transcript_7770/m.19084 type:complete len:215 (-) Transcript_7770:1111-1755(-)